MPSPLAHSFVGLGAFLISIPRDALTQPTDISFKRLIIKYHKSLFFFLFLANLPDLDMAVGLLIKNNAHAFHAQFSHSLLAAFLLSWIAVYVSPFQDSKKSFLIAFIMISLHDLMDFFASGDLLQQGKGVQLLFPWKQHIASPVPVFYGFRHQTLNQLVSIHNLKVVLLEIVLWGSINWLIFLLKFKK